MLKFIRIFLSFGIPLLVLFVSGCKKEDPALVPAYLSVDQFTLNVAPGQGTAAGQITAVWVYANQQFMGAFELPAKIPLLLEGETNIRLMPGIKLNGISSMRAYYPFFKPVEQKVNLIRDSVYAFHEVPIYYRENLKFAWMEDFEGAVVTMDTTSKSTVTLQRISDPDKIFKHKNEFNEYSGYVYLPSDTSVFEAISNEKYEFPETGVEVFLEMNYACDNEFVVGVKYLALGVIVQRPLLYVKPSEQWNKIYVNLTVPKYDTPSATDFQIFIGALTDRGYSNGYLLMDNIKLIHINR
ncbi:hypothetical protein MASR1M74_01430 [Lentimicrobium sp.]